jgi:hypothetical protein
MNLSTLPMAPMFAVLAAIFKGWAREVDLR